MRRGGMGSSAKKASGSGTAVARGNSQASTSDQDGSGSLPATPTPSPAPATEAERDALRKKVLELTATVDEVEKQVYEVNRMRAALLQQSKLQNSSKVADQDKESTIVSRRTDALRREVAWAKRMAELTRQFASILRQIMQHRWAWPFLEPVDVEGLGLTDYFEIVEKPMDLGTIRDRMDAKDGKGYNNFQEICEDVRLVFSNAMSYNEEGTDVYTMAKTLSTKFEEKWRVFEAKVAEEEAKKKQEESEIPERETSIPLAEGATTEIMVDELSRQLDELDRELEDLQQQAGPKCRAMSVKEKRQLGYILGKLSAEHLNRVIYIVAQKHPDVDAAGEEVVVDITTLDPATLWRLHRFVQTVNASKPVAASPRPSFAAKRPGPGSQGKGPGRKQRKIN